MNAQILIAAGSAEVGAPTASIWLGNGNDPNSFTLRWADASEFLGADTVCKINPYNPQQMIVLGGITLKYSVDGGTTWLSPSTMPTLTSGTTRSVDYGLGGVCYISCGFNVYRSTDGGATWADITPGGTVAPRAVTCIRASKLDPNRAYMTLSAAPVLYGGGLKSVLMTTDDGGASWTEITFSGSSLIDAAEWPSSPGAATHWFPNLFEVSEDDTTMMLATPGHLLRVDDLLTTPSLTFLWNGQSEAAGLGIACSSPGDAEYPTNGSNIIYNNRLFNDLHWKEDEQLVIMGGVHGLRYYSTDDGATFALAAFPAAIDLGNQFDPQNRAWALDANNIAHCFQRPNGTGSQQAAIRKTTDLGDTLEEIKTFGLMTNGSDNVKAVALWGVSLELEPGCTDINSCDYEASAETDDGSCTYVYTLTDCEGNEDPLSASNTLLPFYAARPGYVIIDVSSLLGGTSVQTFASFFNGTPFLSFGMNILDGQPPQDRVDQYIGQVIHGINNNPGSGTAYRLPSSLNTLNPGSGNGILWVLPVGYAGQTVSITGAAVSLTHESIVGGPTPPGVLKLVEYPGVCWTVGDPDPDSCPGTAVTITNAYEDCFRCIPIQPNLICQDCDSMMQITNPGELPQQLFSSGSCRTCVNAGDILTGTFLVGFPEPNQVQLQPLEAGQTCSAASNCPVTLTFSGDYSDVLLAGSVFTVDNSGNEYTVASVDYDSGTDVTTIVTEENCQGETFDYVNPNTGCNCQGIVTVRDKNGDVVTQEVYDCVDGYVDEEWTWTVPAGGDYDITFEAEYCGDSRTCTWLVRACAEYSVSETDCHEFTFSLGRDPLAGVNHTMLVEDLSTGAVTSIDLKETAFPYTWTSPGDGVYLITLSNEQTNESSIFEVVDTCDVRECRDTLVRDLLCSCEDPCADDDCSTEDQKEKLRYQLIRIGMLWDRLYEEANLYRQRYLGLHTYGSTRRADLEMIRLLIERIRTVSGNCAQCSS